MTSRRSFIASLAAAFAATTTGLKVMQSTQQSINWDLYVEPYMHRFDISLPFSIEGRTYGTDGRLLISAETSLLDTVAKQERLPDLQKLPWDEFDSSSWQPSSKLFEHEVRPVTYSMCSECGGFGKTIASLKLIRDPDDLYASTYTGEMCEACKGEGFAEESSKQFPCYKVQDNMFCGGYLRRVKELGEFDWKVSQISGELEVLLFRFGQNGKGLLCRRY